MILDYQVGVAVVAPVLGVEHHSLKRPLREWLSPVPVGLALVAERLYVFQEQWINEV